MKALLIYSILIWLAVFLIGKLDPLNINYHLSNAKVIQFELQKAFDK
jgi:uncharacterized membrane-anchored protein